MDAKMDINEGIDLPQASAPELLEGQQTSAQVYHEPQHPKNSLGEVNEGYESDNGERKGSTNFTNKLNNNDLAKAVDLPPPYEESMNSADQRKSVDKRKSSAGLESQTVEDRMTWDNQWEFLMSCISMSVGLGNVWRFPVTAFENGGGAFLIPYFIVLIFIGRPIYFLELCMGQFASFSQVQVWKCAPAFKGVGLGTMVAALSVLTYYCSILALAVFYLVASFQKNLPWNNCDEKWAGIGNCNGTRSATNQSTPEMYFVNEVLKEYEYIDDGIGVPDWKLSICLVVSWLVIYLSIMKGVKSSGKVAYFTAIFPYIVMLVLLVRGCTLPGAWEGIKYFIKPNWSKLYEPKVWYAAVTQCFFSLNTGFGSIIMFASYNPFHHNIYKDSLVVSFMDTFTSLLAGFTIFAVLGNLAYELEVPVNEVVKGGASLAFISYPDAIAKFDWVPQLFAVLFFMMLFTLGVGSAASDAGAIASIFCDRWPKLKRWMVTLCICIFGCSVGLIYVTPGGQWMLDLVDFYGGGFVIYTMSTLEVIGIAWCYGLYSFINDMEFMLGIRLGWYWKICWGFIIPIFLVCILVYSLVVDGSLQHNDNDYPVAATVCGWILAVVALGCVPVGTIHAMIRMPVTGLTEKLKMALKPKHNWGPRNLKKRAEWQEFKNNSDERSFRQRLRDRSGF